MKQKFFRLQAPPVAEPAVLQFNGQILQRFEFIDTDSRIGLSPLGGKHLEGHGIRVPEEWARPASAAEVEHGKWLDRTFFERTAYVTEEERQLMLCQTCRGSGFLDESVGAAGIACQDCRTTGISGPEAQSFLAQD